MAPILGKYAHHIDQISFCCALNSLQAEIEMLPLEYNYPLHYKVPREKEDAVRRVFAIHYHWAVDENSFPVTDMVQGESLRKQIDLRLKDIADSDSWAIVMGNDVPRSECDGNTRQA